MKIIILIISNITLKVLYKNLIKFYILLLKEKNNFTMTIV